MFFFSFPFQTKSEFTVEFSVSDSQGVSVTSHFMVCGTGADDERGLHGDLLHRPGGVWGAGPPLAIVCQKSEKAATSLL